jgi:putative transposase
MPLGLKRHQREGDDHFITFSCYRREPYLTTASSKDTFLDSLELTRKRYNFEVLGYVVMPEHVHLLLSEPEDRGIPLSKALQSLKLSVSTHNKRVEKLKYMHRNPVVRGLVEKPEEWPWSTYLHYHRDQDLPVQIAKLG